MTLANTSTLPTIMVTTGPAAGRSVQIDGEVVVGREHADLTIADAELSRRHAVLRATNAGVVIDDLGSLNGTFVNDQRISGATVVSPDDGIRVGASWLKVVLPAPPPAATTPDPTPIIDTETTRQRPVPTTPDPTPIIDTDTTRQRPVPTTPDPTPIIDTDTTRQRPIIDTETTRQRPVPTTPDPTPIIDTDTTRQRPIPTTPDPTPIIDTDTTRQRPTPAGWEGTRVREAASVQGERTAARPTVSEDQGGGPPAATDADPSEAGPPPAPGGPRGLPASVVTIIALVVIAIAIGIALASNLTSSKSTHVLSATLSATPLRAPQQGQVELTGTQQGGFLGAGAATIDEFLSTPGPSGAAGSELLSARITASLPSGTLISVVKAEVTPKPGGSATLAGTATITGGTARYKHATGTYSITGTQASPSSATIFTLSGSISY
jgi:pSer/pThr/pTyr-binding forkhead associated (FHA) protein